jgi:hypothetical protein
MWTITFSILRHSENFSGARLHSVTITEESKTQLHFCKDLMKASVTNRKCYDGE